MMIPKIEIKVLEKINYADKYLKIRERYSESEKSNWLFAKKDIIDVLGQLEIDVSYTSGDGYLMKKVYENYLFEYRFVISKNNFSTYLYIYKDGDLIQERVSNIGSFLRYIPYNKKLAEALNMKGFVLDTNDKLKNYIEDIIELLDEFVYEYNIESTLFPPILYKST